jgi:hypothetical protein
MTEAKEDVSTIRRMEGSRAAAVRMARTPLMAGRMSSFSLFVVL